jgi:hypothetical protein
MMRKKLAGVLVAVLALSSVAILGARAQDKQVPQAEAKMIPLRVLVVFEEYDGQKKVASLPYTFHVIANDLRGPRTSIRDGLQVPVSTSNSQFTYMDVGADMDCGATSVDDGQFKIDLSVQRTLLFTPEDVKSAVALAKATTTGPGGNTIVQKFSSHYDLLMRDGQTIEAATATNPLSGRLMKVSVTVNVEK